MNSLFPSLRDRNDCLGPLADRDSALLTGGRKDSILKPPLRGEVSLSQDFEKTFVEQDQFGVGGKRFINIHASTILLT